MDKGTVWLSDLAAATGASMDRLKALLQEMEDGEVISRACRFGLSAAGAAKMRGLLGLKEGAGDGEGYSGGAGVKAADGASGGAGGQKKRVAGMVRRLYGNPRLIGCEVPGFCELVTVRVKDGAMFVPGQRVPLLRPEDGQRVWLIGCRPGTARGRLPARFDVDRWVAEEGQG